MQHRYVKDFAIALIFIVLFAMAIKLYTMYTKTQDVPAKSIHTEESVSDTLLNRIKTIENSIQDRKMFVFNTTRDPLRQGNIIKDQVDRMAEFEEMVRNMFRLSTTALDENGNKIAYIEYQDRIHGGRVGDVIEGRRITSIGESTITYYYGGQSYTTRVQPRPERPQQEEEIGLSNLDNY